MHDRDRRLMLAILLLAAALRLPTACFELFHHPDEIWQYLEPAYGMVTGRSVVTWEYRAGMRSWLIPTMLAAPMGLGKAIAPDGTLYLILPRLLLAVGSLAIVGFGAAIAWRISRLHGLVVGLVLATGFELVYFSARALSDTIAVALFVPAAWALLPDPARDRRRLIVGGLLLGLCVSARFQLAPAAGLLAILCCRRDHRAWGWVVLGGLGGLAIDGLVDAAHGAAPFAWMLHNFQQNLVANRSVDYGVEPAGWYGVNQLWLWNGAAPFLLMLAILGTRRQPILALVAVAHIAVHSLIPHKEYRFVWLSEVLLLFLAALGTADAMLWLRRRWAWPRAVAALAVLFWIGASASIATSRAGRAQWTGGDRAIALMRAEHAEAGACGLAYLRPSRDQRVAYLYVDRPISIYFLDHPSALADLRRYGGAFDMVVAGPRDFTALDPAYRLRMCKYKALPADGSEQVCLFVRPGGCGQAMPPGNDVNGAMIRQRR
jgi:hypothetical protein